MITESEQSKSAARPRTSFRALLELIRYARGHRKRIILASICSVLNRVFDVMPEILIGVAIDVVISREDSFIAGFGFATAQSQIVVLAVLTFVIWAGESIFEYLSLILWRNLAQTLQAELRQDAYNNVQAQTLSFFEERSSGELIAILNDDVNQLERFLDGGANELIQTFVSVILVGGVFIIISPVIALLAFTPMPVIVIGAFFFLKKANPLYADVRVKVGELSARLANNIGGISTIKAFTAEERESERLWQASQSYVAANRKAIAVSSAFIPIIRMAILAGFLCTLIVGGLQALDGRLNVGAYGVLVFLTQRLLWPLTGLAQVIDLYERAMASTRRILGLIEEPVTLRDEGTRAIPAPLHGDVEFTGLSFTYPSSGAGVKDVSFHVKAGTTTALVGATGSGKSTLIKLLLRFYSPDAGSIKLDGLAIEEFSLQNLRKQIGLVSQDIYLFDGTVSENIKYGNPDADDELINQAARAAEAWEFIEALPEGLQTAVGERGIKLSGGQRQRLSLARAILKDPPILVLDEATSAVDNETEAAIQRSLARVSENRTVLVIAHRLSTIVAAQQIIVFSEGKIAETGTHQELINAGGLYHSQWMVQTGFMANKPTANG